MWAGNAPGLETVEDATPSGSELSGRFGFWGHPSWLLWLFVHLLYLVVLENRVIVFIQWA